MPELVGYLDRWSVRAGEALTVFAHADVACDVVVDVVPLGRFDDTHVHGPAVHGVHAVTCHVAPQRTTPGSYAVLPVPPHAHATGTLSLLVRPTAPLAGVVAALVHAGQVRVALRWTGTGSVQLTSRDGTVLGEVPLALDAWSQVSLVANAAEWRLGARTHAARECASHGLTLPSHGTVWPIDALWLAAQPDADGVACGHFDGLVEAPALHGAALADDALRELHAAPGPHAAHPLTIAAWDLGAGSDTDVVTDLGAHGAHGVVHQGPTRLVPGAWWRTGVLDPVRDPRGFGAIHFHRDDLRDARWAPSATLALPSSLSSGVYGVRLRDTSGTRSDVVPCWVRAASHAAARPLAVLAPTYTYLAYGNAPDAMLGPAYWGADHPAEQARARHPEFGPSLYSRHPDHSGVSLASRQRPILTVRPGVRPWGFEADRLLTDWLHAAAFEHDVLTDEDIDRDGIAALSAHRVIVTGNHPEYWSQRMLDALEAWLHDGGRLFYTGGNGFYWRISSVASLPGVIECRRPEGGTRPWGAEPGRGCHQLDGEAGGLWRRLGRPPQQLVGVGFAGQGFERSAPYRVNTAARDGWTAFALAGVHGELLGASGRFGGGAAGQEIDRHDRRLGSSPDAVVLASSQGLHDAHTLRTLEELLSHEPYAPDPRVRADLTLTPVRGGGCVCATGSMAWVGALDDPGVAQVMRNVLTRFLDPAPIGPDAGA